MVTKIIFNADDFALTSDITSAIIESHKNGVVMSTTVLGNADSKLLEEASELSKQNPKLGVGAHLVLTTRKPILSTHTTLVDQAGFFNLSSNSLSSEISLEEVYEEWKAQLTRLKEYFDLTHIDSHHHVHLDPRINKIARRLGREFKLPLRSLRDNFPKEVKADLGFYKETVTLDYLINLMSKQKGLVEVMVHPGYDSDVFLHEISSYTADREKELEILTSPELKDYIKENNIQLVNYGFIKLK